MTSRVTVVSSVALLAVAAAWTQGKDLESRVTLLEARVARLEMATAVAAIPGTASAPSTAPAESAKRADAFIVPVVISGKQFIAMDIKENRYKDMVAFDVQYDFSGLNAPARAIKGTLEFADLFGEVKFRLNVTINEPVQAHGSTKQSGGGFDYNHFSTGADWVRATATSDMRVRFVVSQILYSDKTTREFAPSGK